MRHPHAALTLRLTEAYRGAPYPVAPAVPGGAFTYGETGEGFTPNVVVDYAAGNNSHVSLWTTGYGDLTNVIFAGPGSGTLTVRLTADAGYEVVLYAFALAGWPSTDYTIDGVTVTSGGGTALFAQDNVPVQGDATGPGHTLFDFAAPLTGLDLLIGIDFANLAPGLQDNIGIDSIRFGQSPPPGATPTLVPEPASLALFAGGLAGFGFLRRRSRPIHFKKVEQIHRIGGSSPAIPSDPDLL